MNSEERSSLILSKKVRELHKAFETLVHRHNIGTVLHGSAKNSVQLYGGKFSSTYRYMSNARKFMLSFGSFVQDVRLRRAISMLDAKQPMKFREFRSDCKLGNRNFPINSD